MSIVEVYNRFFQLITYTHAVGDVEGELHQACRPPQEILTGSNETGLEFAYMYG